MTKYLFALLLVAYIGGLSQPAFGFSLADGDMKWTKKSVSVCWGDENDLARTKTTKKIFSKKIENFQLRSVGSKMQVAIQSKIQEQFKVDVIGLEFIGWKPCSEQPDSDIVVSAFETSNYEYNEIDFLKKSLGFGKATVARAAHTDSSYEKKTLRADGEKGYVFLRKTSDLNLRNPQNHLLMTALHEFGHAAGLLHEHLQAGALIDPICLKYYRMESLADELSHQVVGQSYGAYDPKSVMNYCNLFSFQADWTRSDDVARLSEGDIHTLRCLYKAEDEPAGSCISHQIKMNNN